MTVRYLASGSALRLLLGFAVAGAFALASSAANPALAQSRPHKPEPWIVSVNHRINLDAHAEQLRNTNVGQDVQVVTPTRGRTVNNLASGVLVDHEGRVLTRLVNLDPLAAEQDIQVTTSAGKILKATFVGFDGPTGLSLLSVPELRGTKPAPSAEVARLAEGAEVRLVTTEYKLSRITVPVERVALYPTLLDFPARTAMVPPAPVLERAGVLAVVESSALTSAKDLSSVETPDGRLIGIARLVSPGRAHILPVAFLRDVVAKRLLAANGNIAAGWLGAGGIEVGSLPESRRPPGAPGAGVLVSQISQSGPADKAGMRRNDLIVAFDEIPVRGSADLLAAVQATPAGTPVLVGVVRDGKPVTVKTILGSSPYLPGVPAVLPTPVQAAELRLLWLRQRMARAVDESVRAKLIAEMRQVEAELAVARGEASQDDVQFDALFDDRILGDLGVEGVALTDQLAKHYGVAGGVLISSVKPASIGDQAGLKAADVIIKAGTADVLEEDDLAESVLGEARAGRTVLEITVLRDGKTLALPIPIGSFRKP